MTHLKWIPLPTILALHVLLSISPTFYKQLLRRYSCTKKLQSQTVTKEKLHKKGARNMLMQLTPGNLKRVTNLSLVTTRNFPESYQVFPSILVTSLNLTIANLWNGRNYCQSRLPNLTWPNLTKFWSWIFKFEITDFSQNIIVWHNFL